MKINLKSIIKVKKEDYNLEKGITLIALIITVLLLIILSTIMVYSIKGDLLKKANEESKKVSGEVEKQQNTVNSIVSDWQEVEMFESKIVIIKNALENKTATQITLNVKATNEDKKDLVYELYTSVEKFGEYTKKTTSNSVAENTEVILEATGLESYTTYYWYVKVTDGENSGRSEIQKVKTYCPGTGITCSTEACPGNVVNTCSKCSGTGSVTLQCPGATKVDCSSCKGTRIW